MNGINTVDETIEQVERLYQSVTGRTAPPAGEAPYAAIPPEKDPQSHMEEQVERLIEALSRFSGRNEARSTWTPQMSAWQGQGELLLQFDLPAVSRESLKVRISNGCMEISGRRTPPERNGRWQPQHVEHSLGYFRRVFPFPVDFPVDQIQAQFKDGVLSVHIPRQGTAVDAKDVTVG